MVEVACKIISDGPDRSTDGHSLAASQLSHNTRSNAALQCYGRHPTKRRSLEADLEMAVSEIENPAVSIRTIHKRFGEIVALDRVSLDIAQGEFFSLLGPSGCGKTT